LFDSTLSTPLFFFPFAWCWSYLKFLREAFIPATSGQSLAISYLLFVFISFHLLTQAGIQPATWVSFPKLHVRRSLPTSNLRTSRSVELYCSMNVTAAGMPCNEIHSHYISLFNSIHLFLLLLFLYPCRGYYDISQKFATQSVSPFASLYLHL